MQYDKSSTAGVLIVGKVTPVILALFSIYNVQVTATGRVVISDAPGQEPKTWRSVLLHVQSLAKDLGFEDGTVCLPEGSGTTRAAMLAGLKSMDMVLRSPEPQRDTAQVLLSLARYFNAKCDEWLADLVLSLDPAAKTCKVDEAVQLADLKRLASYYNDGHGLSAIQTETAYHDPEPSVMKFGGAAQYLGTHVNVTATTAQGIMLGNDIDAALVDGDTAFVAEILRKRIEGVLAGLTDPAVATAVRAALHRKLGEAVQSSLAAVA